MKTFRMKARFKAVRFDSSNPPKDVTARIFGNDKSIIVWFWSPSGTTYPGKTVNTGQWMLKDQYGNYSVVDDDEFRMLYEEIPDAGEGG